MFQIQATGYRNGFKQMRFYACADHSLRAVFRRARQAGHQALFGPDGVLTISDARTGRVMVYDGQARLIHLSSPRIKGFPL